MTEPLPAFRFHPDPVHSGSVERSPATCRVCARARGFVYTGPTYGDVDLTGAACPWCIADGSAHARFGVTFHELELPADAAPADVDELEQRTPGFATFNPFVWPVCCGAPAAYVEPAGIAEIRARHRELEGALMGTIVHELGVSGGAAHRLLESLSRDAEPCAHVFACGACGTRFARVDHL